VFLLLINPQYLWYANRIDCTLCVVTYFPGKSRVHAYVTALQLKNWSVAPHVVQICNTHINLSEFLCWNLLDFSYKLHLAHISDRWCHSSAWRSTNIRRSRRDANARISSADHPFQDVQNRRSWLIQSRNFEIRVNAGLNMHATFSLTNDFKDPSLVSLFLDGPSDRRYHPKKVKVRILRNLSFDNTCTSHTLLNHNKNIKKYIYKIETSYQ